MTKILIADDEQNILTLLEIMLKDLDAEIISAENGEIAINKAKEFKPDLIISDVVMPKKNGFEVCRVVRNTENISNTPIILLSALGDEYNKLTGFEEGADDYIIKPFNVEELKARAKTLLIRNTTKKIDSQHTDHNKTKSTQRNQNTISTGMPTLDDMLYGGLPKGSNILVTGPQGTGKSSFCRQFLIEGLKHDEKSLFLAIDDNPNQIRNKLSEMTNDPIKHYEDNNILRFVDAYSWSSLEPPQDEKYIITGTLELNQLSGTISDASTDIGQTIQQKEGGRRIIDTISSLLINFELSSAQRFLSQIARTGISFGGVTTLFVIEDGTVNEQQLNNIKYIMDGIIELKKENDQNHIRIASMKWAKSNNEWIQI